MAEKNTLKVDIEPDLHAWFMELCAEKRIKQVAAIESIIRFLQTQDDVIQSMILGQIEAAPDLTKLVLERMRIQKSSPGQSFKKAARKDDKSPGSE